MIRKTQPQVTACGYIRMSSAQQESSPEQQRIEISALAERRGFRLVQWYVDEGISGDEIEKRPNFCRMMEDAKQRQFDAILCWDQDRFGRFDSLRAGYVIEPLRMAGVRLITVTQGDINWGDFAGRMIYAIQQEGKNQFLVNLSQNVTRGKIQRAKQGFGTGRSPYGYDRVFYDASGKLVHRVIGTEHFNKPKDWRSKLDVSHNVEEVETVRFIFDRYVNSDANLRSIAYELNQRGIRSRQGNLWQGQSIKALLRNPVYLGRLVVGRVKSGKFTWIGDGRIGGSDPVVVENVHAPLVDAETFERAQLKLQRRHLTKERTRAGKYLLSGFLQCGITGRRIVGRQAAVSNRICYYTVHQSKKIQEGPQSSYSVRRDRLEAFVVGKVADMLNSPEVEPTLRQAVERKLEARRHPQKSDQSLRTRIAALEKKIAKGAERLLLVAAEDLADATTVLSAWRAERRKLAEQLAAFDSPTGDHPAFNVDQVIAELAHLRENFQSADPDRLRAALRTVIEDITLFWGPGGPRKWRLVRGVIRFRENWHVALTSLKVFTKTASTPMVACCR
jgi:DNA invertase Pin-like site-specific DNA recombinase